MTDDPITVLLHSITPHDPKKLAGIRTTAEIAKEIGITKDKARHRLAALAGYGHIRCLGPICDDDGRRPIAWAA